jgi:hypothetical protein
MSIPFVDISSLRKIERRGEKTDLHSTKPEKSSTESTWSTPTPSRALITLESETMHVILAASFSFFAAIATIRVSVSLPAEIRTCFAFSTPALIRFSSSAGSPLINSSLLCSKGISSTLATTATSRPSLSNSFTATSAILFQPTTST